MWQMLVDPLWKQSTSRNFDRQPSSQNHPKKRRFSANTTRTVATTLDIPEESVDLLKLVMHNAFDNKREFELHGSPDYLWILSEYVRVIYWHPGKLNKIRIEIIKNHFIPYLFSEEQDRRVQIAASEKIRQLNTSLECQVHDT